MKGSSLHRAGLSRENMSLLENYGTYEIQSDTNYRSYSNTQEQQLQSSYDSSSNNQSNESELDVLWRSVNKNNDTRTSRPKSAGVYLIIGFILGCLFMGVVSFIASMSSVKPAAQVEEVVVKEPEPSTVSVIAADVPNSPQVVQIASEEKYEIQSGDTLDKIVVRFFGDYDLDKIQAIQKLNNISDPTAIQIGQVIRIPLSTN